MHQHDVQATVFKRDRLTRRDFQLLDAAHRRHSASLYGLVDMSHGIVRSRNPNQLARQLPGICDLQKRSMGHDTGRRQRNHCVFNIQHVRKSDTWQGHQREDQTFHWDNPLR